MGYIFTELPDYKKLVKLIIARNNMNKKILNARKRLKNALRSSEIKEFEELLETLLSNKGTCAKCGILIVGEYSGQRSKKFTDQCYVCAGDDKYGIKENPGYIDKSGHQV